MTSITKTGTDLNIGKQAQEVEAQNDSQDESHDELKDESQNGNQVETLAEGSSSTATANTYANRNEKSVFVENQRYALHENSYGQAAKKR